LLYKLSVLHQALACLTNNLDTFWLLQLHESETIYNLSGQVVGKDYKGIVIKNGKKVLMK